MRVSRSAACSGAAVLMLAAALGCRAVKATARPQTQAQEDREHPMAPEFPAGLQWLNVDRPLFLRDLRGKVVLLDFWTYCCINCMHVIPDLKRLEARYPNELVVIGVHSAKFKNEKDEENIRQAVLRYEIEHPVVNDADFQIWNSYGVRAWPTLVLIRPDGRVLGAASGEGHFEVLDQAVRRLITEYEAKGQLDRRPIKLALERENRPRSVLSYPGKIAADPAGGRLFFTDSNHNRVIIASPTGAVQDVIGEGGIGLVDGGFAAARFFRPQGLCYDPATGTLYVADTENHAVRKVDLKRRLVSTLAGNGRQAAYPPAGGTGKAVSLNSPWDVLLVGGTLYVAMAGSHQLWTIDPGTGAAAPYAGTGGENIVDGPLREALLAQPSGLATDGKRLYFADSEVSAVRTAGLGGKGRVGTLIGQGLFEFGDVDGKHPAARLQHPIGVAWHKGFVYVADTYNHKIKRIDPRTRALSTFIGTGARGMADGPARQATLNEPNGLAWAWGRLYIADTNNHLIRVYDPASGRVSTLKLTGIDRLTRRSRTRFAGREQSVPAIEVAPGERWLEVAISLPAGTKFNPGAPFTLKATSDKPASVAVGVLKAPRPAARLRIPLTVKQGAATVIVQMSVNYCDTGNEGLCYFKEARLVVPLKSAVGGTTRPSVSVVL